jgi:hypothetical protein
MTDLRQTLIEAMAKAFNGTYRSTSGEWVQSSWRGDLDDMGLALDAMLTVLAEHADEWDDLAVGHAKGGMDDRGWLTVGPNDYLAVLRDGRTPAP